MFSSSDDQLHANKQKIKTKNYIYLRLSKRNLITGNMLNCVSFDAKNAHPFILNVQNANDNNKLKKCINTSVQIRDNFRQMELINVILVEILLKTII